MQMIQLILSAPTVFVCVSLLLGIGAAHAARRGPRPGLDPARGGDHVCGGQPHGGGGSAHPHGTAGGRDEGVCPPGHQLAAS